MGGGGEGVGQRDEEDPRGGEVERWEGDELGRGRWEGGELGRGW